LIKSTDRVELIIAEFNVSLRAAAKALPSPLLSGCGWHDASRFVFKSACIMPCMELLSPRFDLAPQSSSTVQLEAIKSNGEEIDEQIYCFLITCEAHCKSGERLLLQVLQRCRGFGDSEDWVVLWDVEQLAHS